MMGDGLGGGPGLSGVWWRELCSGRKKTGLMTTSAALATGIAVAGPELRKNYDENNKNK